MPGSLDPRKSLETRERFSDYRWQYLSALEGGPIRSRAEGFLKSVNWLALQEFAAMKRNRDSCTILSHIGLGYNHMVRIVEFEDDVRWIARLRLPPLSEPDTSNAEQDSNTTMICEVNMISLLRQKTDIPIPKVHAFESGLECNVGAPFMLMDCLEGNAGMDLSMKIPPESKKSFFGALAKVHYQLSQIQLPKIGTIISIDPDGTYQQGPIPGLGGPFDTATEFFKAWATRADFGMSNEQLRAASGQYADEIACSTSSFPHTIKEIAGKLSVRDHGPFPICHGDFGHNNIIVDDSWKILGVIDWEKSYAAPWEMFADFPLSISLVPPAMDVPWAYDSDGSPKSPEVAQRFAEQKEYVEAVKEEEYRNGGTHQLSDGLEDTNRQQLATAMRLFLNGKVGWYSKVVDRLKELEN